MKVNRRRGSFSFLGNNSGIELASKPDSRSFQRPTRISALRVQGLGLEVFNGWLILAPMNFGSSGRRALGSGKAYPAKAHEGKPTKH